jgi:alkylation response protein AidB-like acyl-CoA dehydrogenase
MDFDLPGDDHPDRKSVQDWLQGHPQPSGRDLTEAGRLHIQSELLRLTRLRTVTAAIKGEPPGPEASIRKVMADEHGQHIMELAKDLAGNAGVRDDVGPFGGDAGLWAHGFLFAPAITAGGGTGVVQRNIIGERVLGLPHDVDVEQGLSWAEARRR